MVGRILTRSLHRFGVLLFWIGGAGLVRWLGRKNPKILLYHDCADRETDYTADLECTTSRKRFEEHLSYLARHYRFVDIDTLASGKAPERAVAVTFDDGYASVYENAYPALKAMKVPATIYLISSVVDNRTLVWVNELNYFLRNGGAAAVQCVARHFAIAGSETAAEIISFCRLNFRPEKMDALLGELRAILNLPVEQHADRARLYLTWDQIAEMRQSGIEFGNHSRTHANLECLTDEEQRTEIEQAQEELARLASQAGLESVAEVGGYNSPVSPLNLGRTHIANESVAELFARMEVVEPLKGFVRRRMRMAVPEPVPSAAKATRQAAIPR
jgi:peptidoglycan/xylan/chitin deacetylase (PgdA/CDA1 family)